MCLQVRFTKETQNKCSAPARTPVNRSVFRKLCEFVLGGGCVTAPAAWVSGPSTLASRGLRGRRRRGTRGLPGRARGRGDAGVYTDRRKRPLGAVSGHLCTLLQRCGQTWGCRSVHRSAKTASRSRFGAFVYTVAPTSCVGWHERLNRHDVSATPPRWPPLP